jgi:hypothetical protein
MVHSFIPYLANSFVFPFGLDVSMKGWVSWVNGFVPLPKGYHRAYVGGLGTVRCFSHYLHIVRPGLYPSGSHCAASQTPKAF